MSDGMTHTQRLSKLGLDPFRPTASAAPDAPPESGASAPEEEDGLGSFRPDHGYQAHSLPASKMLAAIGFISGGMICFCPYACLDPRCVFLRALPKPGSGSTILLRFHGAEVLDVVLQGRHLQRVADQIARHRLAWVCALPEVRDFEDPEETVITRISYWVAGKRVEPVSWIPAEILQGR